MNKKCEYIPYMGKYVDIVEVGSDWYTFRKNEENLPKVGAWCKECATETAVPMFPIYMNGDAAYALKCKKCGSEYAMRKSMYRVRYLGYDTPGGHVDPTHGTKTIFGSMDRKAKEYHLAREQRVKNDICTSFGISSEEYDEIKKRADEKDKEFRKKFEAERAESHAKFVDKQIQDKSAERKELIKAGIIKYVKGIGLVDTRTNEVIKL